MQPQLGIPSPHTHTNPPTHYPHPTQHLPTHPPKHPKHTHTHTHTGASVSQIAIAWLLHQPCVNSVVIGVRTLEQLEDNLQSVNIQLSKEEVSYFLITVR